MGVLSAGRLLTSATLGLYKPLILFIHSDTPARAAFKSKQFFGLIKVFSSKKIYEQKYEKVLLREKKSESPIRST